MGQTLPYISIYKGDFLRGHVAACSIAAQGLWFRIMILMHDSERAGYLCLNGLPIPSRIAAAKCAVPVDEYETLLAELMEFQAFKVTEDGILYSSDLILWHNRLRQRPSIPPSVRKQVLSIGFCRYCGNSQEALTVDHIYPYSRGGAHSIENFQCLCWKCNRDKYDSTEEEYFARLGNGK